MGPNWNVQGESAQQGFEMVLIIGFRVVLQWTLKRRDSMENMYCCVFRNRQVVVIYIEQTKKGGFFILNFQSQFSQISLFWILWLKLSIEMAQAGQLGGRVHPNCEKAVGSVEAPFWKIYSFYRQNPQKMIFFSKGSPKLDWTASRIGSYVEVLLEHLAVLI